MSVGGIISWCNTISTLIAFSAMRKLPSNPGYLFSKTATMVWKITPTLQLVTKPK